MRAGTPRRGLLLRTAAALVLSAALVVGIRLLEEVHRSAEPSPSVVPTGGAAASSRVFLVLLDGWAWRDAIDPELMPRLAALRDLGVSAKVRTVYEAFTGPAVQAAFTGRSRTQVFGVFYNFYHETPRVESLFSDLERLGKSGIAYGEGHFAQFGPGVEERIPPAGDGDMYDYSRSLVDEGLAAFAEGGAQLVIVHLQTLDWVAHASRRDEPAYMAEHVWADSVVAQVAEQIGPDATLVVMGDHGHDTRGEHKSGLNVPTFFFGIGPAYGRDVDLGEMAITEVRNLVGLPLAAPLVGSTAVAAQAAREDLHVGAAAQVASRTGTEASAAAFAPAWAAAALGVFMLGLAVVMAAAGGASTTGGVLASLMLGVLAAAALGWGLTAGSPPPFTDVGITLWTVGLLIACRLVLGATPTAVWAGFAAAAVLPMLLATALGAYRSFWTGLFLVFAQVLLAKEAGSRRSAMRWGLGAFTLAATLPLVPFPGHPHTWLGFPPTGLGLAALVALFVVGKALVFVSRPGAATAREIGWSALVMVVLAGMQWWVLPTTRAWQVGIILAFAVGALLSGRGSVRRSTFLLGATFAAAYHAVDLPPQIWAWADAAMGALVATGTWATRGAPAPLARAVRASALAGAALLGYDAALGWRVGGLEWHVLYRWFDPVSVELDVARYIPLILGKSVLVFVALAIALGAMRQREASRAWVALAAKITAVLAFSAGAGLVTFRTAVVMPHFEEAGLTLAFFWTMLLLTAHRRSTPADPVR